MCRQVTSFLVPFFNSFLLRFFARDAAASRVVRLDRGAVAGTPFASNRGEWITGRAGAGDGWAGPRRTLRLAWFGGAAAGVLLAPSVLFSMGLPMPSAPPGFVEAGVPQSAVLSPEAIGLRLPPTDLHVLSDGRILLVARNELAIGDGQRWEVIRKAEGGGDEVGDAIDTQTVAVGADDTIYVGIHEGFARVEFGDDGFWRLHRVEAYPKSDAGGQPVATHVSMTDAGWFWYGWNGGIVRWEPGTRPRVAAALDSVDRIFMAPGGAYTTNTATGKLMFLGSGPTNPTGATERLAISYPITSSAPLNAERALVGTLSQGLQVFDGTSIQPFVTKGPLGGEQPINDLCATEPGLYAAALRGTGLAFFDETGRIVQMLDRRTDHRLARAQRVVYSKGVVWVLLRDGIARVHFPARVSNFEWFGVRELAYARPHRHEGRLWLVSDGLAHRGVYNQENRLIGFEVDSPPGRSVYTLSTVTGSLLATNADGIFLREDDGWRLVVPGVVNARIEAPSRDGQRWVYFARGEYGWLTREGDGFALQRTAKIAPNQDFYLALPDGKGDVWVEMGVGKFGRARLGGSTPTLEIFDQTRGVPLAWANIFVIEGVARINMSGKIFRVDEQTEQLVEDHELVARIPLIEKAIGRPATDARGRLWITSQGAVHVLDLNHGDAEHSVERIPPALRYNAFTMEDGGVVWLHEAQLARFDPAIPMPPEAPLRTIISQVIFTVRRRTIINPPATLPPVNFSHNSIALHFAAPNNSFGPPIDFELMVDNSDTGWTSTAGAGSAVLNDLKEGAHTLRVRARAGTRVGEEATLSFVLRPPWYRTTVAYVAFGLAALGVIIFINWILSFFERRDRARLAQLVERRTGELHQSNRQLEQQVSETLQKAQQLQASEERYRRLSGELERRVELRTAELHHANDQLIASNQELEAFSYSVSHDLRAPLRNISGFATLLQKRAGGEGDPETDRYLTLISDESVRLGNLITSLLVFSRLARAELNARWLPLPPVIEAARDELALEAANRVVEWRIGKLPKVWADPTLLRQVFANLLGNALKFTRERKQAVIEIGAQPGDDSQEAEHVLFVRDNGAGFDPKYSDKLFGVFQRLHSPQQFEGTGIGLATVRRIIGRHGGRVWADGALNGGATFFFSLPKKPVSGDGTDAKI